MITDDSKYFLVTGFHKFSLEAIFKSALYKQANSTHQSLFWGLGCTASSIVSCLKSDLLPQVMSLESALVGTAVCVCIIGA